MTQIIFEDWKLIIIPALYTSTLLMNGGYLPSKLLCKKAVCVATRFSNNFRDCLNSFISPYSTRVRSFAGWLSEHYAQTIMSLWKCSTRILVFDILIFAHSQ